MPTTSTRKHRGYRSQRNVANFLRRWFPFAESTGAGRPGEDVTGVTGLSIEVKARSDFNPVGWLKQCKKNAGEMLPMVVSRPNGVGDDAGEYLAIFRLADIMEVIGPLFGQESVSTCVRKVEE